jgi:hypothetical protein
VHIIAAIALSLPLTQSQAPAKQMLDTRWIPSIGIVELSTTGRRLEVVVRERTASMRQPTLDALPSDARIVDARSSQYLGDDGLLIGLAVEHRGSVSYHYLTNRGMRPNSESPSEWQLSEPIFTSTGDRYRITDVYCAGADQIEITFRRGHLRAGRDGKPLDEKIYVNDCPGTKPFVAGKLFETSITNAIADPTPRFK